MLFSFKNQKMRFFYNLLNHLVLVFSIRFYSAAISWDFAKQTIKEKKMNFYWWHISLELPKVFIFIEVLQIQPAIQE